MKDVTSSTSSSVVVVLVVVGDLPVLLVLGGTYKSLLLLLLYTLFIVEIKTGKMPNNIGPTVNNMLKDIVEKKVDTREKEKGKMTEGWLQRTDINPVSIGKPMSLIIYTARLEI